MSISIELLQELVQNPAMDAWKQVREQLLQIWSSPFSTEQFIAEITRRERDVASLDLFLAGAGWDLWRNYEEVVPRTSQALTAFWQNHAPGRAILILDGLSLREMPWILMESQKRGLVLKNVDVTGAELPPDTTPFAKSLGFAQRSALENNQAGQAHVFIGARTDCVDIAWGSCAETISGDKDWVLWHHWPDRRVHDLNGPGQGMTSLASEARTALSSDDFWRLVDRMATGRELVITSDHGYAASGLFPDVAKAQADYLKTKYGSSRHTQNGEAGNWVPPLDLEFDTKHGRWWMVLGRRKWKSAGGYPTLTHGGLSLMEVFVPFIQLTR